LENENTLSQVAWLTSPRCIFQVTNGHSAGATFNIPPGVKQTAGSGIHNDIVLHGSEGNRWAIALENKEGKVHVTALMGNLEFDERQLDQGETILVTREGLMRADDTEFRVSCEQETTHIVSDTPIEMSLLEGKKKLLSNTAENRNSLLRHALFGFSVICVAIGTLSAIYFVTGSVFMANADGEPGFVEFTNGLKEPEFKTLEYKLSSDQQTYIITGIVDSREQKTALLDLANRTGTKVELDLQLNSELIGSVEDIYRVNGIPASAEVVERGKLTVNTQTHDLEKLSVVELSVKQDIPQLSELVVNNTPPATVLEEMPSYKQDPDKRVTLIKAGDNAYIMTQDQSRYFVGALLPSGHTVEGIENGEILVSKDGKTETMKYN